MLGRNGVSLDVPQIGLSDDDISDRGEVWNVELATDLVVTMLSVRTMVSKHGPARVDTTAHQSNFIIPPPQFTSLVVSLARSCPDIQHASTDSHNSSSANKRELEVLLVQAGSPLFGQPIVVVKDFLEMLPK